MGPDSDVDLLVIKSGVEHRRRLAQRIHRAMIGVAAAVDVVVATPEDIERFGQRVASVLRPAGVLARIDLVELNGREAVPVDYKKGKVPDTKHRALDPERVQVCLQGLLLRENGYDCDHGIIYFAAAELVSPHSDLSRRNRRRLHRTTLFLGSRTHRGGSELRADGHTPNGQTAITVTIPSSPAKSPGFLV